MSVVIRTFTEARWDELVAAVDSVRAQVDPPKEIVVVVDHEPRLVDRALARLRDVVVVDNHQSRGASGSLNSGIAAARSPIIALLDDDAVAAPSWLRSLVGHYRDDHILGVGGRIIPVWAAGKPAWFPEEFYWVVGCTYRGVPTIASPIRNLIGANMSFRRSVWEIVGGFRMGVGAVGAGSLLRGEETEFCIRVSQSWPERRWMYEPEAQVYHHQAHGRSKWSYFRSICYGQGLTKAQISRLLGSRDSLDSERSYAFKTLPAGVVGNVGRAVRHLDVSGFGRAGAIVAGLCFTTAGYVVGAAQHAFSSSTEGVAMAMPVVGPASVAPDVATVE